MILIKVKPIKICLLISWHTWWLQMEIIFNLKTIADKIQQTINFIFSLLQYEEKTEIYVHLYSVPRYYYYHYY